MVNKRKSENLTFTMLYPSINICGGEFLGTIFPPPPKSIISLSIHCSFLS